MGPATTPRRSPFRSHGCISFRANVSLFGLLAPQALEVLGTIPRISL